MFRVLDTTRKGNLFSTPFAVFALCVIGYGAYRVTDATPESWTLVLAIILGVLICSPLQIRVGRAPGFPLVGVAIVMLAIPPVRELPILSISIWAIGILLSQLVIRRSLMHALYVTGLGSAAASAFVLIHIGLTDRGVWSSVGFIVATLVYYAIFLVGEFARHRVGTPPGRILGFTRISPIRLGSVILVVAMTATIMRFADTAIIPWLEQDPHTRLTPFIVLLVASIAYMLAQRSRFAGIERRLSRLVDAAVELPIAAARDELSDALLTRARKVVQAGSIELRAAPPERNEIGARIELDPGVEQHLVASRKIGGGLFLREDDGALATLAHLATETARTRHEIESLETRADSDALTGLPNYGAFQKALADANENRSYHEGIALLFIDLDNFKKLNDGFGHRIGDELLKVIAGRLRSAAGGGDFVSRVGGDEFVVIFSDLDSLEQARASSERIVAAASQPLTVEGRCMRPTLSAGLAFSSHRELDAQSLVEDADRAMLNVKRSRRSGDQAPESSLGVSSHRAARTNDIVARAIREDRLVLAFQPIVDIRQGEIWAFEALVRYVDPELGPVSPPSLVARAKSLGLMNELTRQVITKALDAAEDFRRLEPGIRCITVNLELGQITEAELGPFVREAARLHPDIALCIELNERSLHAVTDELRRDAEIMQSAGVLIALDDYGSEASSVGALVHFPMNILKIDKSLIDNLDDVRQREVIKALQGFGDNLDYTVIVEGIENREMAEILGGLGVRSVQGYYFGRPISHMLTVERLQRWGRRAVIG